MIERVTEKELAKERAEGEAIGKSKALKILGKTVDDVVKQFSLPESEVRRLWHEV